MKLTEPQILVLRILADGREHETTTSTRQRSIDGLPDYVAGTVAAALKRRGLATVRGWPLVVTITEKGRTVLAAIDDAAGRPQK